MQTFEEFLEEVDREFIEAKERYSQAKRSMEIRVGCPIKTMVCSDIGTHIVIWVQYKNAQGERWWRQFETQKNTQDRNSFIKWVYEAIADYSNKLERRKFYQE